MPKQTITYNGNVIDERDVSGTPAIVYNGKIIGDVLVDKPRTLQTEKKAAKTNIVIGSAVLACEGKALTSDILVETVSLIPALEDISWAEVSAISKAGLASQYWKIGDIKTFTCSGYTCEAQIIGFDHDDVTNSASYGRNKAGITFQFKNVYPVSYAFNKYTSYYTMTDSDMYKTVLPSVLSGIYDELKAVMVGCNKLVGASTSNENVKTLNDIKLTLPAASELADLLSFWNATRTPSEGAMYEFYTSGNSLAKGSYYWTRTIRGGGQVYCVTSGGGRDSTKCTSTLAIAPIFFV